MSPLFLAYAFEVLSDDLVFPYTKEAWQASSNSKDTIALTIIISPDDSLAMPNAVERIGRTYLKEYVTSPFIIVIMTVTIVVIIIIAVIIVIIVVAVIISPDDNLAMPNAVERIGLYCTYLYRFYYQYYFS